MCQVRHFSRSVRSIFSRCTRKKYLILTCFARASGEGANVNVYSSKCFYALHVSLIVRRDEIEMFRELTPVGLHWILLLSPAHKLLFLLLGKRQNSPCCVIASSNRIGDSRVFNFSIGTLFYLLTHQSSFVFSTQYCEVHVEWDYNRASRYSIVNFPNQ